MEESKDLQTLYKVFRTFIYVSLLVEFFEYAINPDVLDHWGGILVEIHDRLKLLDVYQNGRKRVRDAAFFLIIMLVTFAATLLKPQKYVSSRTIQKCVEHVSTST